MKKFLQNLAIVAAVMLSFATNAQVSTFPYTCGFEDATENANWTLTNGSETNKWYIGTAVHNTGSNALYISNNSGTSNAYTNTAESVTMASRTFTLTAGTTYSLSFNWLCEGEDGYDFMRVFLCPASTSFSAGTNVTSPAGNLLPAAEFVEQSTSWNSYSNDAIAVATSGNYNLVFYWENDGSVGDNPAAAVDDIVFSVVSCATPTGLLVSNITTSSVDFGWTADAVQTMWDVIVSDTVITDWTAVSGTESTVSTNPYTITGLTSQTRYYAYVRANCGSDGASNWAGPLAFNTAFGCDQGTYALAVTGESTTTGTFTNTAWGSSYSQVILTPEEMNEMGFFSGNINTFKLRYSANPSAYKNVAFYMGNTTQSPVFNSASAATMVPASQMQLVYTNTAFKPTAGWQTFELDTAFYWDGASNLCIGYVANYNATSGTTTGTSSTSWSVYGATSGYTNRVICNYADNTVLGPASVGTSFARYNVLPDMTFEGCTTIPSCYNPNQLAVSDIVSDSATLSWNQRGSASSWNVAVSDTVVTDFDNLPFYTTTDTFYVFDGLNGTTHYYVYVQANCGADISDWVGTDFWSACGLITTFPWSENFDSWEGTTSTTGANNLPICWSNQNSGTSYSNYPIIYNTASYAQSGSNTLRFYSYYGTAYSNQIAILPEMDNLSNLMISIDARCGSASYVNYSKLAVGVMDSIGVYTWLDTLAVNTITYQNFEVSFADYQGTGNRIALCGIKPTTSYCNINVDDLMVYPIPTCVRPINVHATNIANDEATIAWTERADATSWIVEYSDTDFDPTDVSATYETESVSSTPEATLTNLQANTLYYVYVASDCGSETSVFTGSTFRTACDPIDSLPYTYGFEDATAASTTGTINSCWGKGTNYTTAYPYPSSTNHSGTRSLYFYSSSTAYCYAVMPAFDEELSNLILTFWNKSSSTTYTGSITVGVMTNPYDISTFTAVEICNPSGATWTEQTVGFANYTGTGRYIAFYFPAGTTNYAYLDDITVDLAPSCPAVTSVEANNVSYTSARVSWDYTHGVSDEIPDDYTLVVKEGGNVVNTINNAVSPVQLSGLTAGTEYTVLISSSCSGTNGAADSVVFATLSLPCLIGDFHDTVNVTGTAATAQYTIPVNNFYNYTYTQQLILASELDTATNFAGIAFSYAGTSTMTSKSNVTIYMANTTNGSLGTPLPISAFTQVYSGSLNCAPGWNYFMFDTPFASNGTNVVVAIDDNSGAYNGTSYTFNVHTASGKTLYYQSDGTNPDPANPPTMTAGTYRNEMKLIAGQCLAYATCLAPSVALDSMSATSIAFSWAPGLAESSWDVEYRAAGESSWTTEETGTSLTSTVLTGLNPNTTYTIRVGAICSDTTVYGTLTVTTPCVAQSLPFSENFETWTVGSAAAIDGCWKKGNNYSTYPYLSSSYGSKAMYMYSTSSSYSYLALPFLEAPVDSLQVSFQLYRTSTTYNHRIDVGVMVDPSDITTFTHVAWANPTLLSQWENFEINLDSYTGTGRYIAFVSPNGEYSYPYLDNIYVDYIPTCPRPTNVTATNLTQHTALIGWTHAADEFEVQYGPAGFALGNGTTVSVSQEDTVTIAGLASSTMYEVYVRALCEDNDTGTWSFATRFATLCGTIDDLPYTENFNNWGAGTSIIPICWHKLGSTADRPYINTSTTYGRGGDNYALYFYAAGSGYCYGIMPPTSHQIDSLQVSFWSRQYSTSYDCDIVVGVMTDPTDQTTFVAIDTVHPATTTYEYFEIPLSNYQDSGRYIAFSSILHGGSYIYMLIDDVELDYIPSCLRPEDLVAYNGTTTTATLSWTTGTAAEWEVQIDTIGGTFANAASQLVTSVPFTATNLTPGSQYQYRVRAICGIDDTSRWSRETCAFGTAENPAAVPYSYDFETDAEYANWKSNSNSTVVWTRGAAGQSALDTTGSNGMFASANGTDATLLAGINNVTMWRDFDFGTDTAGYLIEFDATMGGTTVGAYHGIVVYFIDPALPTSVSSAALTTPWGFANDVEERPAIVWAGNIDSIGAWNHFSANVDNVSGIKRLGFYMYTQNDSEAFVGEMGKFDNLSITLVQCERPSNLATDTIGSNYADLSWQGDGVSEYEIMWRQYPQGANTFVTTIGNHYTLTGLEPGTRYAYWVRKTCAPGDTSDWSDGRSFYTECAPIMTLPWSENFDNVTTNQSTVTGDMPYCWTLAAKDVSMTADQEPSLYYTATAGYATSGRYSLRMYYRGILALPEMGHAVDSLMMTFNVRQTSSYYRLVVGVLDSLTPGCEASFTPVDTIVCTGTSALEPQTIYFANYAGTGRYIAFRNYYLNSTTTMYSYNYIDDIVVDWMPTCFPVLNVHADVNAATTNSVTIDWDDMGGVTAPEYEIAYHTSSFTPGTGVGNSVIVTSHPAVVSGLNPASNYQVYVRPICTAGDTAVWSRAASAQTGCDIIQVSVDNSYSENFNSITATTYSTAGHLPACWDAYYDGTSTAYYPHVVGSGSYWYSPDASNSLCLTSGSGSYGPTKYVRLPEFSGSVNELTLHFWYQNESATSGTLEVGYFTSADLSSSFTSVRTFTNNTNGTYDSVSFANAPDSARFIGFKWYYNSTYYSVCIDNVVVTSTGTGSSCVTPSALNAVVNNVTADLSWASNDTVFEVSYKVSADAMWSAPVTVNAHNYTLTYLNPETSYDWRVRTVCDTDAYSNYATGTFTTGVRPCYTPENLQVSNITANAATLTWTLDNHAVNPLYWIIALSDGTNETFDTIDFNGFTTNLTNLVANTNYSVRVQGQCATNDFSSWSESVQFATVECLVPTGVQVSNTTMTTADVSWTAGTATAWQVSVCEVGMTPDNGVITDAAQPSTTLTNLNPNHDFVLYVRTVCGDNWYSDWSEGTSFRTSNITFTITTAVNDPAMGTVTGGGTYEANTTISLTATANAGYHFVRWQEDGSTQNPYSIVVDADYTYTAVFAADQGIDDVNADASMAIYPNPATTTATISLAGIEGKVNITIVDMSGRKVATETVDCAGDCTKSFNVTNLAQGAYFVRIESEGFNTVKKLVVK